MSNTKVSVILQARTSSTRLPGKVLKELSGRSMLEFQVERIRRCDDVENIILATSTDSDDDVLASLGESLGIIVVRGPLDDVLSRFILATEAVQSETFIRITGDCPFVDPSLMSEMIHQFNQDKLDYLTNACPPTYPDGLDIEIFSRQSLCLAHQNCSSTDQREHVTPWIRESGELKVCNKVFDQDLSHIRLTVDEPEDLALIRSIVDYFQGTSTFLLSDIIDLLRDNPGLFSINKQYKRNEGATLSSGQKLWRRAKRVIPGGNMLLSKRPDMFLPSRWPSYFSSAKGCIVTDLDGKEYIDMSIMGIGTNILGYGNEQVDETVLEVIQKGNMSTLNCPEEVYLAERLVEIHPWADMARFARSGGEANAIAIRIARAATGREKIAICGYHGWHDWYLASNLNDSSSLNEHLLPGLSPDGVPKSLAGTTIPFNFNDIKRLKEIIRDNDLAAIKMEVQRNVPPLPGFLEEIRALCFKNNIVLIFDECTSGFRETFGGHHLTYGVMPDLAMFGKTLGNGYAITAVVGTKEVMESAVDLEIPNKVDYESGKNWGEIK